MKKLLLAMVVALLLAGPVDGQPTYTPDGQPTIEIPGSPYVYTPDGGMAIRIPGSPYAIPLQDGATESPNNGYRERQYEQPRPGYGQDE